MENIQEKLTEITEHNFPLFISRLEEHIIDGWQVSRAECQFGGNMFTADLYRNEETIQALQDKVLKIQSMPAAERKAKLLELKRSKKAA